MATNQLHGKKYEDILKAAFPGSSDYGRTITSEYDIESRFDRERHLPTEIKTTKDVIVCLSDARKFWRNTNPMRLLVVKYKQSENYKTAVELYDFIITSEDHKKLLGNISYDDVEIFHNSLTQFSPGIIEAKRARLFAKNRNLLLKQKGSIIKLNPKIDSKTQRRLQASVSLIDLIEYIPDYRVYDKDNPEYRGVIFIGSRIKSSSRKFND